MVNRRRFEDASRVEELRGSFAGKLLSARLSTPALAMIVVAVIAVVAVSAVVLVVRPEIVTVFAR